MWLAGKVKAVCGSGREKKVSLTHRRLGKWPSEEKPYCTSRRN